MIVCFEVYEIWMGVFLFVVDGGFLKFWIGIVGIFIELSMFFLYIFGDEVFIVCMGEMLWSYYVFLDCG